MDENMVVRVQKDMDMDIGMDMDMDVDVDVDEVVVDIMKVLDHMSESMEVPGLIPMIVVRNIRAANSKI